jgi:hypothetical protein
VLVAETFSYGGDWRVSVQFRELIMKKSKTPF